MSCGRGASSILRRFPHPNELGKGELEFRSTPWKKTMCQLYRTILKLHAVKLQPLQRELGDKFVHAEFHRHIVANEKYSIVFYQSWLEYCVQVESGITERELTKEERDSLNEEQQGKLKDLRTEAMRMKVESGDFIL